MLVATAIASMIILSSGILIHQTVFFFDRGTGVVDQSEKLVLAIDRLADDFAAVRFVVTKQEVTNNNSAINAANVKAAFVGSEAFEDDSAALTFITAGGRGLSMHGDELIRLTVEEQDGGTELVRRRAAWPGPIVPMDTILPNDPIVLLRGKFTISFRYSELNKSGELLWYNNWTGERGLPYSVRMVLRDKVTDADLFPPVTFRIRANAPPSCTAAEEECYLIANDMKSAALNGTLESQAPPVPR